MNTKIKNLRELVEYPVNGIISKDIIDNDNGSITIFAFDKGQKLSEHTAPFDAFVNILEGEAEISIDGNKNILIEGDAIIMPANIPHSVKAIEKFKMLLTMISNHPNNLK
ncbi:MAG TPA: cupin domain-containing protein [Victivallales bacterium]|nr:cupin domain-containing protein [Victivallales bacterium]HPO90650.1 cupin domain-containing protein [Victivallales bacterium]HRR06031.1 cupin domain-containing protein [Victivallales bacterium]HRR28991.1 cupin domain-containing protein [Victivallales bacterium]